MASFGEEVFDMTAEGLGVADQAITEVLLPLMGEGVTEASLVKWLKKPGEKVSKGEPLVEVSTDKVDTEIPSPVDGYILGTFADEGTTIAVNALLAHIGSTPGVRTSAPQAKALHSNSSASNTPISSSKSVLSSPGVSPSSAVKEAAGTHATSSPSVPFPSGKVRSSPLVRKLAKEKGVDLAQVAGTGLSGRITKQDFESFVASPDATRAPEISPREQSTPRMVAGPAHLEYGRLSTKVADGRETIDGVPVRREKMSKMRTLIAEHMVRSVRTSPHVTTVFEIDMHQAEKLRSRTKGSFQAKEGFGLTYTAIFAYLASQAIKRHPIVNVSVDGEDILWKDQINLGVAVAIDSGLIVPVIRNAGELNLTGIARRLNDIVTRARSKKLLPEDVQGGTFTVTNPGMFGSLVSSPIINQPQVAILSIGAIIKRPVVIHDMIAIRPLVQVGLTFDHRVVDGEGGAKFLATFKELAETMTDAVL
jgi:pyruvate dehydrogenase E2 component (dihydrolipoamide acetyltransferase)